MSTRPLVWILAGFVAFVVVVFAASAVLDWSGDKVWGRHCVVAATDAPAGDTIVPAELAVREFDRDEVPDDAVTKVEDAAGRAVKKELAAGTCITAQALAPRQVSVLLPADAVHLSAELDRRSLREPVDILFSPVDGQDPRTGAIVEGAVLHAVNPDHVVVRMTSEQRSKAVEYLGRSTISVVPSAR